jgi:hypothetical protein
MQKRAFVTIRERENKTPLERQRPLPEIVFLQFPMNSDTAPNWIPLPDPITEDQVRLELSWKADPRTQASLERQPNLWNSQALRSRLLNQIHNSALAMTSAANLRLTRL